MRGPLFIGVALAVAAAAAVPVNAVPHAIAAVTATTINCKKVNAKYPHGVGLPGAHDKSRSNPVTNFTRNRAVYLKYKSLDRDHDGIACEKH